MAFDPLSCRNESEVESKFLVQYLLPQLGYSSDTWFQEVALGQIRLDLLAFTARMVPKGSGWMPSVRLVIEAKHPGRGLDAYVPKLQQYLRSLRVRHGLLTNGREVRVYEWQPDEFDLVFQCEAGEIDARLPALRRLVGRGPEPEEEVVVSWSQPKEAPHEPAERPAPPAPRQAPSPVRERSEPMQTIAIYHNKGGVGKTTTVVNLAAALAKRGMRVLVIDLDAQANTTYALGLVRFDDETQDDLKDRNIAHVLSSEELFPLEEVARVSRFGAFEVDVLPAHISLMQQEVELNQLEASRLTLLSKLRRVKDRYDVVLIDTPPSLNLFARIALIAADHLIIPSDLKPFANQGLVNVLEFIRRTNDFRRYLQLPPVNLLGVLATKISTNHKFAQTTLVQRRQLVAARYGVPLLATEIHEREDLAKCAERIECFGERELPAPQSILDFNPESPSAKEFEDLAHEVLTAIGARREVMA